FAARGAQVVFGLRHSPAGGNKMLFGVIYRAQLYDRALSAEEIAASAGIPKVSEEALLARMDEPTAKVRGEMIARLAALQKTIAESPPMCYAVTPRGPELAH